MHIKWDCHLIFLLFPCTRLVFRCTRVDKLLYFLYGCHNIQELHDLCSCICWWKVLFKLLWKFTAVDWHVSVLSFHWYIINTEQQIPSCQWQPGNFCYFTTAWLLLGSNLSVAEHKCYWIQLETRFMQTDIEQNKCNRLSLVHFLPPL